MPPVSWAPPTAPAAAGAAGIETAGGVVGFRKRLFAVHLELDRLEVRQFVELRASEGGLCRPAPAYDDGLEDRARRQALESVVGHVGADELVVAQRQHPREVESDVAVADDDRPLAGKVEGPIGEVGVPVVPADELHGRVAPGKVLPGIASLRSPSAPTA